MYTNLHTTVAILLLVVVVSVCLLQIELLFLSVQKEKKRTLLPLYKVPVVKVFLSSFQDFLESKINDLGIEN